MSEAFEQLRLGFSSESAEQTKAIAERLARELPEVAVLALHGDLGAGKTTFVQGLAEGLGINESITSPSYNVFCSYDGTRQLVHVDAYRLEDPDHWPDLMLEDFLQDRHCVAIEWPEKLGDYLPEDAIHLYFRIGPNKAHHIQIRET